MKLDEIETGLKEVAEILRQVKHYVAVNNIHVPDGMSPVLALMCHHESLENELRHNWKQIRCPEMVNLPTNVEQARAMATVGTQWLLDNAPSELTIPWQELGACRKHNQDMASLLTDINEYCQQNNISTIGDSASKALMTHHKALAAQVEALRNVKRYSEGRTTVSDGYERWLVPVLNEDKKGLLIKAEDIDAILAAAPQQQHLAEVKARASQAALEFCDRAFSEDEHHRFNLGDCVKEYTDSIQRGKK